MINNYITHWSHHLSVCLVQRITRINELPG